MSRRGMHPMTTMRSSSDTPRSRPHSDSRFGSLLASVRRHLSETLLSSPACFEIRHIRTGETAPLALFHDGTLADRTARTLGPDWRVFRVDSAPSASQGLDHQNHCQAATHDLVALYRNLINDQPVAQNSPPGPLPANAHLQPGQLTVAFANAADLEQTLAALSHMVISAPQVFDAFSSENSAPQLR